MKIFPKERLNSIVDYVNKNGKATIHQLARQFSISIPTVRRDLNALGSRGLVKRSHGGAVATGRVLDEITFESRMKKHYRQKMKIARYAASLIKEGEVIILDTGTTNYLLARLVKEMKNITVITNSIKAASELAPNKDIKNILVGGSLRADTLALFGALTAEDLRKFNADKVFLGGSGLHWDKGMTDIYEEESEVKKVFIEISKKKIALLDSSKLGVVSFSHTGPLAALDMVISDSDAESEIRRKFDSKGPKFYYL